MIYGCPASPAALGDNKPVVSVSNTIIFLIAPPRMDIHQND